jgi:hypothetical protein
MTINDLVTPLLARTDAEIVAVLNASTVQKSDSTRYTWAGLMLRFGTATCMGLSQLLDTIKGSDPIKSVLINPGVDFSLDETQGMLDQLAPALGAESTAALKAIGRWTVTPYNDAGFDGQVTIEQVTAARTAVVTESWWATVQNEIVNPLLAAGASKAEIKAAIAELK